MLDPWKSSYKYINFDAPNAEETWRTTGKKSQGQGQGKGVGQNHCAEFRLRPV